MGIDLGNRRHVSGVGQRTGLGYESHMAEPVMQKQPLRRVSAKPTGWPLRAARLQRRRVCSDAGRQNQTQKMG